MTSRQRFLNAFTDLAADRPPIWLMRQAGRYLPEYRALKARSDFLTMVKTPDLAAEVTLQPLLRYPNLDAAIIFSDILILPEAMGQGYAFRETGGIEMQWAINSAQHIDRLEPTAVAEKTAYLPAAIRLVRQSLGNEKAVLGFCGAPWTLATYMIEGGSTKNYQQTLHLFHTQPALFSRLMEKLTAGLIQLLRSQIDAGIDALQIFDSWAIAAPQGRYYEASLRWIEQVIAGLPDGFPVIVFAKGMQQEAAALAACGASALAADQTVNLAEWRQCLPPHITLQGNLAPEIMAGDPQNAILATRQLLRSMHPWKRYIFNLGHGLTPDCRPDTVGAVIATVAAANADT